jgi:hypothetical protein
MKMERRKGRRRVRREEKDEDLKRIDVRSAKTLALATRTMYGDASETVRREYKLTIQ